MKLISTKVHGVLDYLMGALFIGAPWLLGFADGTAKQHIFVVLGIAMILLALITDYELGAVRLLSMRSHLTIDILSGLMLAASPWLFGFSESIFIPHLVIGATEVLAALVSDKYPSRVAQV